MMMKRNALNMLFRSRQQYRTYTMKTTRATMDTVDLSFMKITQENESSSTTTTTGKKPLPLVIIHGLFGSKMNFYSFSRAQSREYNRDCYLLDLRNHGTSGHHDTDMTFKSMAHDIYAFLDKQGIEKCDLLGFSLGGKVSMTASLIPENECHFNPSERIRKLIIGDIAPLKYNNEEWDIPDTIHALSVLDSHVQNGTIQKRSDADQILKENGITTEGVRGFLLTNLDRTADGQYYWKFNLRGLRNNLSDIADFPYHPEQKQEKPYTPFNNPTLFIVGERSRLLQLTTPKVKTIVDDFFPQNKMVVFENCGHWVHTENPKLFKHTVETFLNEE
jgi:pimeloyl-ACP methyl ester carboxylesterase